jgi:hypothetical protein
VSIHRELAASHVDDDVVSRRLLERNSDMMLHFVEAPQFTSRVRDYFDDGEYAAPQWALVLRPVDGALIPGSGGLRKLRWRGEGRGKSGGYRVIYHWRSRYMLEASPEARLKAKPVKLMLTVTIQRPMTEGAGRRDQEAAASISGTVCRARRGPSGRPT